MTNLYGRKKGSNLTYPWQPIRLNGLVDARNTKIQLCSTAQQITASPQDTGKRLPSAENQSNNRIAYTICIGHDAKQLHASSCQIHPVMTLRALFAPTSCTSSDPRRVRQPPQIPLRGADPSAPASQKTAGGSPLHFMSFRVHDVPHYTKAGGRPPQHQDPDRGLAPSFGRSCQTLDPRQVLRGRRLCLSTQV